MYLKLRSEKSFKLELDKWMGLLGYYVKNLTEFVAQIDCDIVLPKIPIVLKRAPTLYHTEIAAFDISNDV